MAAQCLLIIGIVLATPLCLLPCKDTVEELWLGQNSTMTEKQNLICTIGLCIVACLAANAIPNIGDAMTVIGATSNPVVGFTLPIIFWLKMDTRPKWHPSRILAHAVNVFVLLIGLLSITLFVLRKTGSQLI